MAGAKPPRTLAAKTKAAMRKELEAQVARATATYGIVATLPADAADHLLQLCLVMAGDYDLSTSERNRWANTARQIIADRDKLAAQTAPININIPVDGDELARRILGAYAPQKGAGAVAGIAPTPDTGEDE